MSVPPRDDTKVCYSVATDDIIRTTGNIRHIKRICQASQPATSPGALSRITRKSCSASPGKAMSGCATSHKPSASPSAPPNASWPTLSRQVMYVATASAVATVTSSTTTAPCATPRNKTTRSASFSPYYALTPTEPKRLRPVAGRPGSSSPSLRQPGAELVARRRAGRARLSGLSPNRHGVRATRRRPRCRVGTRCKRARLVGSRSPP
jgi:hypothetical protein